MNIAPLLFALIATSAAPESREPVLLDFHAPWCGPCQQMVPAIQQLVDSGYPVRKIDIDETRELAQRYKVDSVPTFIVVDASGRELARAVGPRPAAELASLYRQARAKAQANPPAERTDPADGDPADDEQGQDDGDRAEEPAAEARPAPGNPHPWKTGRPDQGPEQRLDRLRLRHHHP